jgi:alpha-amylase
MTELVNGINQMKGQMATSTLGSFLENHDNPRFPSLTSDIALAKNAIAFTILMDGIPIIYQGQEQHFSGASDPNNREPLWTSNYATNNDLYPWIAKVNQIRNQAIFVDGAYVNYQAVPISPDSKTIALRKGTAGAQVVSVHTNIGAGGSAYSVSLPSSFTGFTANQALTEVLSCTKATTDGSGALSFSQGPATKVFYPTAKLSGSGICATSSGGDTDMGGGSTCATVAVTFNEVITTSVGQTVKVYVTLSCSLYPPYLFLTHLYRYTALHLEIHPVFRPSPPAPSPLTQPLSFQSSPPPRTLQPRPKSKPNRNDIKRPSPRKPN